MEQKYKIGNDYGSVLWDVQAILENRSVYPIVEYPTQELARRYPFHGDPEYAMKTDPSLPGIMVRLSDDHEMLIDGNHRLFKAVRTGQEVFRCRYLQEAEHKPYIVDYDPEVYNSVIDHWQSPVMKNQ